MLVYLLLLTDLKRQQGRRRVSVWSGKEVISTSVCRKLCPKHQCSCLLGCYVGLGEWEYRALRSATNFFSLLFCAFYNLMIILHIIMRISLCRKMCLLVNMSINFFQQSLFIECLPLCQYYVRHLLYIILIYLTQPYEVGIFTVPISQMGTSRFRGVKPLPRITLLLVVELKTEIRLFFKI